MRRQGSGQATASMPGRPHHHRRADCRGCGGSNLHLFLSLGDQPLANAFPADPAGFANERFYPLDVFFCRDCTLVQLLDVVDPEVLFGHYLYVTGTSDTMAAHNEAYAQAVVERLNLRADDLVAEVASNDGSLLAAFRRRGVRVLGIEPARNIAGMAQARGIETVVRFFARGVGAEVAAAHGHARAIVANNVFAHVDDPVGFLAGCAELLTDDGMAFIEFPWALEMLRRGEYDTIYHEHLSYMTVTAVARMAAAARLTLAGVERIPVHGGSIRARVSRSATVEPSVHEAIAEEEAGGLTGQASWDEFGSRAADNRDALVRLLLSLRDEGKHVAAYGAPAKGNTLLNYCGIDSSLVSWTVDRNPLKVGLYSPGMHLPVLPVSEVMRRRPNYLLILAWNFADEIMEQQAAFASSGGRFIIPIPYPRVL